MLRRILARGCHAIHITHKASKTCTLRLFRGIPKFTGLVASDEDEQSASHQNSSSFFYHGYALADCAEFVKTKKSNGENCKLSVLSLDGVAYAVSGSKNTCQIWPIDDQPTLALDIAYPSGWIARTYCNCLRRLHATRF